MLAPLHFPEFLRDDPLSERSLLALATLTKVTVDIKLYVSFLKRCGEKTYAVCYALQFLLQWNFN